MTNGPIPRKQAMALQWMQAFSGGISSDPARYGVTAADAAAIAQRVAAYEQALLLATSNRTRTPVAVNDKDNARISAEQICLHFYAQIKINDGVSDDDKIAIGVRPVNRSRSRRNVPSTSPTLDIIAATPGAHTLRYHDSLTPDSPAKPFGAVFLQVYAAVGDETTDDVDDAREAGLFTKNPIGVTYKSKDNRKMATYFTRWVSRTGETGPWSLPVSMAIAS